MLLRCFLLITAALTPVFAQVDLSGEWDPRYHEDQPERIPGPFLGDYLGLPINEAARSYARSWDASRMTLPEHQCMVHVSPYISRGPGAIRIWQEKDPESQQLVAIKIYFGTYQQTRTVWMDGRPHPPAEARHTWMGFSTGKFEGDILTITTTHIKQGWVRRNGVPQSDRATMVDHLWRRGNVLTHMTVLTDPVYLTEPLVKTQNFVYDTKLQVNWIWPCEPVEEVDRGKGIVPHYMPGQDEHVKEFARVANLPLETVLGGAETMYPEYQQKVKTLTKK